MKVQPNEVGGLGGRGPFEEKPNEGEHSVGFMEKWPNEGKSGGGPVEQWS